MEKKSKAKEIWENYSIFSRYIRGQVKKEKEKAKEQGRQFTVKQAKSARRKYARRARITGAEFVALAVATGIAGYTIKRGYEIEKNYTNQQQIEQETQEQQPTSEQSTIIKIKPQEEQKFNKWKDELKVNTEQQNSPKTNIKNNIEAEIGDLKTSEEILQYVKQQYVDEYNKNNKQKIKVEDIEIKKSTLGDIKEHTKNNKYIYDPYANTENSGVYTIKHKGRILEEIARTQINSDYKQAYRNGEEQKETNTENIYAVVATGIDYCIGYDEHEKGETNKRIGYDEHEKGETNKQVLITYKNRLINSVYKKEIKKYQSLKESQEETKQTETDKELE